jgi:hypothetical protein
MVTALVTVLAVIGGSIASAQTNLNYPVVTLYNAKAQEQNLDYLKTIYGKNRKLPPGFELQALSHYPELKPESVTPSVDAGCKSLISICFSKIAGAPIGSPQFLASKEESMACALRHYEVTDSGLAYEAEIRIGY